MVRLPSKGPFGKKTLRLPSIGYLAKPGSPPYDDPPCSDNSYCRAVTKFKDLQDVARRTGSVELSEKDHRTLVNTVIMEVKMWDLNDERAPFSVEELVVIALLLAGPLEKRKVRTWILKLFAYYHQHPNCLPYHTLKIYLTDQRLDVVFSDYYIPIITTSGSIDVDINAARLFLRGIFDRTVSRHRAPPKAVLFLTMPAELRIKVYKYVLNLPHGLIDVHYPSSGSKVAHLRTIHRHPDATIDGHVAGSSEIAEAGRFNVGSLARLLAFSQVNKQLYNEVSHFFFSKYRLLFESATLLHKFVMAPAGRFNSMTRIAFGHGPQDIGVSASVFDRLAQLPNLRYINLHMNDGECEDLISGKRLRSGRVVRRDNGALRALRRLTITDGKTVFFTGGAKKVEEVLATL